MDDLERRNIIDLLKQAKEAVKTNDINKLKALSDRTIHSSSIEQDSDYIFIAVAVYALFKLFGRQDYRKYNDWGLFYNTVVANLDKARIFLEDDNEGGYERCLNNILNVGKSLESNLKRFVQEVIASAKISKGSRVYEHGISLERSAELLGVSAFELLEYSGSTGIGDVKSSVTQDVKGRLEFARSVFK